MPVVVSCPACGHSFRVREESLGRRGKCPRCGEVFLASAEPIVEAAFVDFDAPAPASAVHRNGANGHAAGNGHFANGAPMHAAADESAAAVAEAPAEESAEPAGPRFPMWGWAAIVVAVLASGGAVWGAYNAGADAASAAAKNRQKAREVAEEKKTKDMLAKLDTVKAQIPGFEKQIKEANEKSFKKLVLPGIVKVLNFQRGQLAGTGSGFFINDKQWIVTNHHVIANAEQLKVKTVDGSEWDIEGILADPAPIKDLAVLKPKVTIPNVKPLHFPKKDEYLLTPGSMVYGIGNPGTHEFCVTRGVVTRMITQANVYGEGIDKDTDQKFFLPAEFDVSIIEFDARIYPGNSGGPLLNEDLEVVGINTWGAGFRMQYRPAIYRNSYGMAAHYMHIQDTLDKITGDIMTLAQNNKEKRFLGF